MQSLKLIQHHYHMTVLIVDDDRATLSILTKIIESLNHKAIAVTSGEMAITEFNQGTLDLIIMDAELTGHLNGFQTTEIIRQQDQSWIPVIFLSSHNHDDFIVQGIQAGGDDYLVKPVSAAVLKAKMLAMARIAQMRSELIKSYHALENLTFLDSTTHLLNRRGYNRSLTIEWRRMQRDDLPLSLIFVQIDLHTQPTTANPLSTNNHFSEEHLHILVNNLQSVAQRAADTLARYEPLIFALLLPNTPLIGAKVIAERLHDRLFADADSPFAQQLPLPFTLSLGITSSQLGDIVDAQHLEKTALRAVTAAQQAGGNQLKLADQSMI